MKLRTISGRPVLVILLIAAFAGIESVAGKYPMQQNAQSVPGNAARRSTQTSRTEVEEWSCKYVAVLPRIAWEKGDECEIRLTARPPADFGRDLVNVPLPPAITNSLMEALSNLVPAKSIHGTAYTDYVLDVRNHSRGEKQSTFVVVLASEIDSRMIVVIDGRPYLAAGGKKFSKDAPHISTEVLSAAAHSQK